MIGNFEIGDNVKVTDESYQLAGCVGTIVDIDYFDGTDYMRVEIEDHPNAHRKDNSWTFTKDCLELIRKKNTIRIPKCFKYKRRCNKHGVYRTTDN